MDTFTLFVVLPWEEVISVRDLPSGVTVSDLWCRLELQSGCPSNTYKMVSSDGRSLQDDQPLVVSVNVWDGYMVRLVPLEKWRPVYEGVIGGNLDEILSSTNTRDQSSDDEDTGKPDADVKQPGFHDGLGDVALFLSCWFGHSALCKQLLDAGVDPNDQTLFGRSPLFACVVKDHDRVLNILMKHGAKPHCQDLLGETVLEVAKRNISRQCINRIRSFQANRIQPVQDIGHFSGSPNYGAENHSIFRNAKDDKIEPRASQKRQTRSARILSANSNSNLLGKDSVRDKDTNSKNGKYPGKDNNFNSGMMTRSVTYDAGFINNNNHHRKTKHIVHVCPSQHTGQRHSPQLMTPRSLRNNSESGSRTNTPRSPPPMSALRVALPLPHSKCPGTKKSSQHTVTWDEHIASSDFFTGNREGKAKTCNGPSNGFRDLDDNHHSNSWQLIGQPFSPRHTARSVSPDKNHISITIVDSNGSKNDENTNTEASNVTEPDKESEETSGKMEDANVESEKTKTKKPWSASRRQQHAAIHKNSESLKTARRRIQLSEQQKRNVKKKETFEQWLKKKRRQKLREESSEDSSDSSDDEERKKSNTEAFNNWIKELGERNIKQINPNSAISLHKRKSRALQGLIGIGNNFLEGKENEDTSLYMHSYNTWRNNRAKRNESGNDDRQLNVRKAKKDLDALRNNVLAEAVSFEEWMEHAEERKKLSKIISKSKDASLKEVNDAKRANSASKQVSFEKWKQELEAKEAKRKIKQLRKRRQQEQEQLLRDENRSSSAVAHDMWLQRKAESQQKEKQTQQNQQPRKGNCNVHQRGDENTKNGNQPSQTAFDSWVNTKHEAEIQKMESSIRHEQQLLGELRRRKEALAT